MRKFVLCTSFAGSKLIVCSTFTKSLPAPQEILVPFWRPEHCASPTAKSWLQRKETKLSFYDFWEVSSARHPFFDALPSSEPSRSGDIFSIFFCLQRTPNEIIRPPHPPTHPYPPWVSLSTYAEAPGFAYLYPRMLKRVGLCLMMI